MLEREGVHLTKALRNAASRYAFDLGQPSKAEPLSQESIELGRERLRQFPESNLGIFEFVAYVDDLGETCFLQSKTQPAVGALMTQ